MNNYLDIIEYNEAEEVRKKYFIYKFILIFSLFFLLLFIFLRVLKLKDSDIIEGVYANNNLNLLVSNSVLEKIKKSSNLKYNNKKYNFTIKENNNYSYIEDKIFVEIILEVEDLKVIDNSIIKIYFIYNEETIWNIIIKYLQGG